MLNHKSRSTRRTTLAAVMTNLLGAGSGLAAGPAFELGTIQVSARKVQVGEVGEEQVASVVTRQDMQTFNRENVADAVNLLPGISVTNGTRNEKMINVRGYDVRQVPLYIDGIPVYVPYDGYVDFNRFSTFDLAAIQVVKGFSSVAYGPNAIGGAINLISRKPREKLEGDATIGFASGNERKAAVNVGTNQGLWYLQAGASYIDSDYFPLSSDFQSTASENGGHRDNSYRKDSRVSLKLGLTPNATDEYALSYVKQDGEKGQPPNTIPASARYWQWPSWDKESLYFLSKTALGQHETLKTRLYVDTFKNGLATYTNGNYNVLKTSGSGSVGTGRSLYDDRTTGGSVELESTRIANNTLRLVTHYRSDRHQETDALAVLGAEFKDTLFSIAAEDNIQLAEKWLLSVGYAHHELRPEMVFKSTANGGSYALPDKQKADNGQIGLFYDFAPNTRFYATVAQKTRLPTLKDRYSGKLGTYDTNPNLQPEASINYEIGYQGSPWVGAKAEAALFYSEISDKIQSVFVGTVAAQCSTTAKCQMRNVGEVHTSGIELSLRTPVASWLEVGGNFTYLNMDNVSNPSTRLTGIPDKKFIAYAIAKPLAQVDVIPYVEYNTGRWASNTVRIDGYTIINLKTVYRPLPQLSLEAGVTNLTDKNYELDYGFPNPGRMWFANANYRF
ncbi:TonB-dependent siderophore receptor [Dechloromonas sp. CZR5]|uniref:TonB-dependent receptor plug domain-containing protein n=1 Tax=Dechloromonas sp. CZR5 TaxID=2608630 RepID=UPI00123D26F1|nr:TonB-dependent receptor [Dechloromonas sp. CZR5]